MALTVFEQSEILSGNIGPSALTFEQLIELIAVNYAVSFKTTYTIFDLDDELLSDAREYVSKIVRACNELARQEKRLNTVKSLKYILASLIAGSNYTYAQVSGASDDQWATFIEDQIDEALENYSGVLQHEKIAYNALP